MARKPKPSGEQQVANFIAKSTHPLIDEIIALRTIILNSGIPLTEHIKWNAPSFCFEGQDRLTFKLNSPKTVDIVLHRGPKVQALPEERLIEDPKGLIKWATTDRGVISFRNMEEIHTNKKAVENLVNDWIRASSGESS